MDTAALNRSWYDEENRGQLYPARRPQDRRIGRKVFLGLLGVGAGGLLLGRDAVPAQGLASFFVPADGFRIYTIAPIPVFHPATYRLAVDGLVSNPLSLTYNDVRRLPVVREVRDYHCVTGWVVPHVHWEGLPFRAIKDMARPSPDARFINLYSADGVYTESLALDQALDPDVMIGYSLNGKPLSQDQGAPLRLVIPKMYGYKYIKWLNRIEFATKPLRGYWEGYGYAADAYLNT